jgi:hypothetical protein
VIFSQIGIQIGFVAEAIVRGAFMALWIRDNQEFCNELSDAVRSRIET